MYSVAGQEIVTQIVPIPKVVLDIPGRMSSAVNELVFKAIDVSPMGYQSFYIHEKENEKDNAPEESLSGVMDDEVSIYASHCGIHAIMNSQMANYF